jgi:hypothetical protein
MALQSDNLPSTLEVWAHPSTSKLVINPAALLGLPVILTLDVPPNEIWYCQHVGTELEKSGGTASVKRSYRTVAKTRIAPQ